MTPSRRRLRVDPIACIGHGLCADMLPEIIDLDDWGFPRLAHGGVLPPSLVGAARRAATTCPTLALHLEHIAETRRR